MSRYCLLIAAVLPVAVQSHGAITFPPARNAIDSNEMPWGGPISNPVPFEPWCPFPSEDAVLTDPGHNLSGANGQACFWFSK